MFQRMDVPVFITVNEIKEPFVGGLNNPQFSEADFNRDGKQDLLLFDRGGDVVLTYLGDNTGNYSYAPEYACNFPPLVEWVLLRDYNKDGAADIFCASTALGTQEVQVFRGYYDQKNNLQFTPFKFSYPTCSTCNPLYIWYPDEDQPGFFNNLPINKTDIPAIDDVDGDGDLDILAFPSGNSTNLWFFKNTSVESGFGTDSLHFRAIDRCWGKFYENGFLPCKADMSPNPGECANGFSGNHPETRENRHPGATLMTFDQEGDGDKDLVFGNISFQCLGQFTNNGSLQNAWMTKLDTLFPSDDVSVQLYNFPAAFYLDINMDGKKDMVVSSNSETIGEDQRNVWLYLNYAPTPQKHQFALETKKFLVKDMIDLGTSTHPAFVDVNADGLTDLVVGNYGYFTPATNNNPGTPCNASLYYFKNIGTSTLPAFELTDTDWMSLSQFTPNDFDFSPTFGDLDSDGDLDMLVGNNSGGCYFFRNEAGPGNPMLLSLVFDPMWYAMDIGVASTPAIHDLNEDGLPDVIVGERQGNINYFKNIGTPTNPIFSSQPTLATLGAVDTDLPGFSVGYSCPQIVVTAQETLLISGSQHGFIEVYNGLSETTNAFLQVSDKWGNLDDGARTHPALADIDEDGMLEMVVGNQRGGLTLYKTILGSCTTQTTSIPQSMEPAVTLQPNPANTEAVLKINLNEPFKWEVSNIMGQFITSGTAHSHTTLNTSTWEPGVYWVIVATTQHRQTLKLIVK